MTSPVMEIGGRPTAPAAGLAQVRLIQELMPRFDVAERHEILIHAPVEETWQAALDLRMSRSRLVRLIMAIRTLPSRFAGHHANPGPDRPLLAETQALGWRIIGSREDRELVLGAVTQPWKGTVVFRGLSRAEFLAFAEPGYAAIAWTLECGWLGPELSFFRTETRVRTTDEAARRRFRRYWRIVAPGIITIRHMMLRLVRRDAERRFREEQRLIVHPGVAT